MARLTADDLRGDDLVAELEQLVEDSANAYDDWWESYGITTLRRRYRNERDAALAGRRALQEGGGE